MFNREAFATQYQANEINIISFETIQKFLFFFT